MVRPNYKLNCVWCTVELKVIGNLEYRIKFYREKKPRHFFYTIEYPYPPTNSVAECLVLLTANAEVAAVLGSIPASSDTVESEGRWVKQC